MNGNRYEEQDTSTITRKPWYQCKQVWINGLLALAVLVFWYMFYRPIEVTRGPWQVLDPGKPVEPLKFEVAQEGSGPVVEPGDLIQVSLKAWLTRQKRVEDNGNYWIWVGFRTERETPFHTINYDFSGYRLNNTRLVSAFVGLKEGAKIKFLESPSQSIYAGHVFLNPFGDSGYSRRRDARGESRMIYIPTSSGYTVVHVEKVFKGQLKYRTTHLYNDTWFFRCYNFLSKCEYSNTPREGWVDDARYDGVSADGKRATFQYGPVATPGIEWIKPGGDRDTMSVADGWVRNKWRSLPVGVQVE
jgi:hypothetical protein